MTDYFKEGYQERCDEVNKLEGEINIKITQLKTIGKSGSTISVEKEIEKLLSEYNSKLNCLNRNSNLNNMNNNFKDENKKRSYLEDNFNNNKSCIISHNNRNFFKKFNNLF